MIKIRLFCAAGMSTSILGEKMKEAAKINNNEFFEKNKFS